MIHIQQKKILRGIVLFLYFLSCQEAFSRISLKDFYHEKVLKVTSIGLYEHKISDFHQKLQYIYQDVHHYLRQITTEEKENDYESYKQIETLTKHLKALIQHTESHSLSAKEFKKLKKKWEAFCHFHMKNKEPTSLWDDIYTIITSQPALMILSFVGGAIAFIYLLGLIPSFLDDPHKGKLSQEQNIQYSGDTWDRIIVGKKNYRDLITNPELKKIIWATGKVKVKVRNTFWSGTGFYLGPYQVAGKTHHLFMTNKHVLPSLNHCHGTAIHFYHGPLPKKFQCQHHLILNKKMGTTSFSSYLINITKEKNLRTITDFVFFTASPLTSLSPGYQYRDLGLSFHFNWAPNKEDLFTTAGFGHYHKNYLTTQRNNQKMDLIHHHPQCRLISRCSLDLYVTGCDASLGNSGSPVLVDGKIIGILSSLIKKNHYNIHATNKCLQMYENIQYYFPEMSNLAPVNIWGGSVATTSKTIHYNMTEYLKKKSNQKTLWGSILTKLLKQHE